MDTPNNKSWNILNWNIRGLNTEDKRNAIRAKIEESACAVFCMQETKIQSFDHSMVRKMAPKRFNKFAFVLSEGASGVLFVGWNDAIFSGELLYSSKFAITIKFTSIHNVDQWILSNVYGPCSGQERHNFTSWLNSLNIEDDINWMLLGDFNFYRSLQDRNREGGNMNGIMTFNEIISNVGLQDRQSSFLSSFNLYR
jgi:exonuclease III